MQRVFHKQDWEGSGQWKELAKELNVLARRINNITGQNGITVRHDWKDIKIDGGGAGGGGGIVFNGDAYDRAGNKTESLNSDSDKPWIKYSLSTGVFTEETGPPSEPWGNSEVWRKKTDIHGSLYLQ